MLRRKEIAVEIVPDSPEYNSVPRAEQVVFWGKRKTIHREGVFPPGTLLEPLEVVLIDNGLFSADTRYVANVPGFRLAHGAGKTPQDALETMGTALIRFRDGLDSEEGRAPELAEMRAVMEDKFTPPNPVV